MKIKITQTIEWAGQKIERTAEAEFVQTYAPESKAEAPFAEAEACAAALFASLATQKKPVAHP